MSIMDLVARLFRGEFHIKDGHLHPNRRQTARYDPTNDAGGQVCPFPPNVAHAWWPRIHQSAKLNPRFSAGKTAERRDIFGDTTRSCRGVQQRCLRSQEATLSVGYIRRCRLLLTAKQRRHVLGVEGQKVWFEDERTRHPACLSTVAARARGGGCVGLTAGCACAYALVMGCRYFHECSPQQAQAAEAGGAGDEGSKRRFPLVQDETGQPVVYHVTVCCCLLHFVSSRGLHLCVGCSVCCIRKRLKPLCALDAFLAAAASIMLLLPLHLTC